MAAFCHHLESDDLLHFLDYYQILLLPWNLIPYRLFVDTGVLAVNLRLW